jgi:hypothetical protein
MHLLLLLVQLLGSGTCNSPPIPLLAQPSTLRITTLLGLPDILLRIPYRLLLLLPLLQVLLLIMLMRSLLALVLVLCLTPRHLLPFHQQIWHPCCQLPPHQGLLPQQAPIQGSNPHPKLCQQLRRQLEGLPRRQQHSDSFR